MNFKIFNIVICTLVFISVATSCKKANDKEIEEAFLKTVVKNNLGKKLALPNELKAYRPFKNYIADSIEMQYANYRIYSYINSSCGTCVEDIQLWDNLVPEFIENKTVIYLICGSTDQFELIKHMCESGKLKSFSYPFFLDVKNKYVSNNPFMNESKHFETVLTNQENTILLMGNPIRSKAMKDLFIKEIKERMKIKSKPKIFEGVPLE